MPNLCGEKGEKDSICKILKIVYKVQEEKYNYIVKKLDIILTDQNYHHQWVGDEHLVPLDLYPEVTSLV